MASNEGIPSLLSKERLLAYADPGILILIAIKEFFVTILRILFVRRAPAELLRFQELRDKAFSDFWQSISPPPLQSADLVPPLEGALTLLNDHFDKLSGVVLDVGPGTGRLTHYYPSTGISAIYGAEPNEGLHPALRANAASSKLAGRYHILSCGADYKTLIPGLVRAGLLTAADKIEPVFDTIIAARVLCAVDHLPESLEVMYALLKPGGKFLVAEHVVSPYGVDQKRGSFIGRLTQILYRPFWNYFIRCNIDADTEGLLMKIAARDGGWGKIELKRRLEWATLVWVGGVLVKRKT